MPNPTPREIAERLVRLTAPGPNGDLADLFAEDAVLDFPFSPPGAPQHAQGREMFRAHLLGAVGLQRHESTSNVHIRETEEPGTVVIEYRLHGSVVPTGKQFAFDIITVAHVHDGLISWLRTYSNPLDGAIAFDAVPDLVKALTTQRT
ncbi:nuclear transport factor 2 family protein [Actinomadura napierensis]|uniref:Nuclear transport factor 2 family protein n=1 Tax=Actinomadura napierensis TaxID=267854 RepID=A0ABN2Y2H8_9ACTN